MNFKEYCCRLNFVVYLSSSSNYAPKNLTKENLELKPEDKTTWNQFQFCAQYLRKFVCNFRLRIAFGRRLFLKSLVKKSVRLLIKLCSYSFMIFLSPTISSTCNKVETWAIEEAYTFCWIEGRNINICLLSTVSMSLDKKVFSLITHSPNLLNYTVATERRPMVRIIPHMSGAVTLPPSNVLPHNPLQSFSRFCSQ